MKSTDCNFYSLLNILEKREDGRSKSKGSEYKDKHKINYLIGAGFLLP